MIGLGGWTFQLLLDETRNGGNLLRSRCGIVRLAGQLALQHPVQDVNNHRWPEPCTQKKKKGKGKGGGKGKEREERQNAKGGRKHDRCGSSFLVVLGPTFWRSLAG